MVGRYYQPALHAKIPHRWTSLLYSTLSGSEKMLSRKRLQWSLKLSQEVQISGNLHTGSPAQSSVEASALNPRLPKERVDQVCTIAARSLSAILVVFPDGHPVRGVALAELGKLLCVDVDEDAKGMEDLQNNAGPSTMIRDGFPAGAERLKLSRDALLRARTELRRGFGGEGGEVAREVEESIRNIEKEWKARLVLSSSAKLKTSPHFPCPLLSLPPLTTSSPMRYAMYDSLLSSDLGSFVHPSPLADSHSATAAPVSNAKTEGRPDSMDVEMEDITSRLRNFPTPMPPGAYPRPMENLSVKSTTRKSPGGRTKKPRNPTLSSATYMFGRTAPYNWSPVKGVKYDVSPTRGAKAAPGHGKEKPTTPTKEVHSRHPSPKVEAKAPPSAFSPKPTPHPDPNSFSRHAHYRAAPRT
ncbi:hypothetical protein FRB97_004720, partial [Tulasnella sp. 331]